MLTTRLNENQQILLSERSIKHVVLNSLIAKCNTFCSVGETCVFIWLFSDQTTYQGV